MNILKIISWKAQKCNILPSSGTLFALNNTYTLGVRIYTVGITFMRRTYTFEIIFLRRIYTLGSRIYTVGIIFMRRTYTLGI